MKHQGADGGGLGLPHVAQARDLLDPPGDGAPHPVRSGLRRAPPVGDVDAQILAERL